jgi:hypothetical protein
VWSKSDAARALAWRDVDPSVNLTNPEIEFDRELPRIAASAAVGFPMADAIPFEIGERPSAEGGQQTCPNCPHPMAMQLFPAQLTQPSWTTEI